MAEFRTTRIEKFIYEVKEFAVFLQVEQILLKKDCAIISEFSVESKDDS